MQITLIPFFVNSFLTMCKCYVSVRDFFLNIYITNETVKFITDKTYHQINWLYCVLNFQRMEPSSNAWISKSSLLYNPTTELLKFEEEYIDTFLKIITADIFTDLDNSTYANLYFSKLCGEFTKYQLYPLMIFKSGLSNGSSGYIVRRGNKSYDNISFKKSSIRFLSIEYTSPSMNGSIEFNLGSNWFYVGNELFTPTFVLRMLEYQPTLYFFEEDYKITIMDNQCNIFTISNNEYIVINKDDYEIKPVDEEDVQDLHDVHDVEYDSESADTVIVEGNVQDLDE